MEVWPPAARRTGQYSDVPAFPPATVSTQPPDDRIAVLNNTIKDLRNVIEDIRRREEDLRQERDRWHVAYLAAQRLIPTPAQTTPRPATDGAGPGDHGAGARWPCSFPSPADPVKAGRRDGAGFNAALTTAETAPE
jgi:hypothetical protein